MNEKQKVYLFVSISVSTRACHREEKTVFGRAKAGFDSQTESDLKSIFFFLFLRGLSISYDQVSCKNIVGLLVQLLLILG